MNIALIEKFLLEFLPPEAKNPVHNIIDGAKENPSKQMFSGFNHMLQYMGDDTPKESAAAVSGVLFGIVLAYGAQRSPQMESYMEDFIAFKEKNRGANVVDFASRRAEGK